MNARKQQQSRNGNRGSGSKNRNRNRNKKPKIDPAKFWGDSSALPDPDNFDTDSPEPLAVVHSLGRAPLPGVVAEPYFAAVYDRAAGLAYVLSDAAGLDDLTPVESDPDAAPTDTAVSDAGDEEE